MKSLFKSFLRKKDEASVEGLNHVSNLQSGDMVELDNDFSLPGLLRGRTLEVVQKTLYEYEDSNEIEWVLKNEDSTVVFLAYQQDDGEENLSFSMKLIPSDVESIFNMDEFSTVFDDEHSSILTEINPIEKYSEWLGKRYSRTEFAEQGFYHKTGSVSGQGEAFDYFALRSDCERFGIGIEVWEGGETDVFASINQPLSVIKDYWGQKTS